MITAAERKQIFRLYVRALNAGRHYEKYRMALQHPSTLQKRLKAPMMPSVTTWIH